MNTLSKYEQTSRYAAPAAGCAADVLILLARLSRPLTSTEIARELGVSRSLVFRTLHELESRQLVERADANRFRLGLRALEIGGAYVAHYDYSQTIRDVLLELAHHTGQVANLGVLSGAEIVYVMKQEGVNSVVTISRIGQRLPANCSAMGKITLAQLSPDELRRRLSDPLPALTPRSIVRREELIGALEEVRNQGYAIEQGESVTGRSCIAVQVRIPHREYELAAISVSMAEQTYVERRDDVLRALSKVRDRLDREARSRSVLDGNDRSGKRGDVLRGHGREGETT